MRVLSHSRITGLRSGSDVGKDLVVVNNEDEAVETYQWLLTSDDERQKLGENARERIFREHTYHNRATLLSNILKGCDTHLEIPGTHTYHKMGDKVVDSV